MAQRGRPRHPGLLTQREEDVLALLREGLTNQQIAERLGISFETAKHHISQILSKLGVATREEAAAWQPERAPSRWTLPRIVLALGGMAVFAAAVAVLALLAWGVSRSGDGGQGERTEPIEFRPSGLTTDEFYADLLLGVSREGQVLHVVYEGSGRFAGADSDFYSKTEEWIDQNRNIARVDEYTTEHSDTPQSTVFVNGRYYYAAINVSVPISGVGPNCPGLDGLVAGLLVGCFANDDPGSAEILTGEANGKVIFAVKRHVPVTNEDGPTGDFVERYAYLDSTTWLPVLQDGGTEFSASDDLGVRYGTLSAEFVSASALPEGIFADGLIAYRQACSAYQFPCSTPGPIPGD